MKKFAIIKLAGKLANQVFGAARNPFRWLTVLVLLLSVAAIALAQESVHPLKPLDRSSPRAALKTFLDLGDAVGISQERRSCGSAGPLRDVEQAPASAV
jgi:hypothetical protein